MIYLWQHFNQEAYREPRVGREPAKRVPPERTNGCLVSSVLAGYLGGIHWHPSPVLSAVFAPCWGPISLLLNVFSERKNRKEKERIKGKKKTPSNFEIIAVPALGINRKLMSQHHTGQLCAGASCVFALYFHSQLNQTSPYLECQWCTEAF